MPILNCASLIFKAVLIILRNLKSDRPSKVSVWEGVKIPMKEKYIISNLQNTTALYYQIMEPTVVKEAQARQKRILDAD